MRNCLLLLALACCVQACANLGLSKSEREAQNAAAQLAKTMSGTFSSAAQAERDSSFYDISLVMYPIWENDPSAEWLYVEQAVTEYKDKPYRQRVYRIARMEDGQIESRVYELPEPENYIHAWEDKGRFTQLSPDDLMVREGCSVFMTPQSNGCYQGSTKPNTCSSTLRGASYASSAVEVCPNQVVSWDQGWDDKGEQVWGAVKEGYVFDKLEKSVF